jgi:hypothetical protein
MHEALVNKELCFSLVGFTHKGISYDDASMSLEQTFAEKFS